MGMSEDRAPYKRPGQPEENSLLDRMSRALQVHKKWIWNDSYKILKLTQRVDRLEREMTKLRETLDHFLTPGAN